MSSGNSFLANYCFQVANVQLEQVYITQLYKTCTQVFVLVLNAKVKMMYFLLVCLMHYQELSPKFQSLP